jgi:hypothetical protein
MIGNNPALLAGDPEGVFEHQLEALEGQPPTQLGSVMQGLIGAANEDHNLARVFSTFTATNPSIFRVGGLEPANVSFTNSSPSIGRSVTTGYPEYLTAIGRSPAGTPIRRPRSHGKNGPAPR